MSRGKRGSRLYKDYNKRICSSPWVAAFQTATVDVLINHNGNGDGSSSRSKGVVIPNSKTTTIEEIEHSLAYLIRLDGILQHYDMKRPPTSYPPCFEPFNVVQALPMSFPRHVHHVHSSRTPTPTRSFSSHGTRLVVTPPSPSLKGGRYEIFAIRSSSDDKDDQEEKERESRDIKKNIVEENQQTGDFRTKNLSSNAKPFVPNYLEPTEMDTLFLLIRLYALQADLYIFKARLLSYDYQWMAGADALHSAIFALRGGLQLADANFLKYLTQDASDVFNQQSRRRFALEKGTDILHVSAQSFSFERNRYLSMAERHLDHLQKLLVSNHVRRSRPKDQMGEKWCGNLDSSNSYWELEKKMEEELGILKDAVGTLLQSPDTEEQSGRCSTIEKEASRDTVSKTCYNWKRQVSHKSRP